jgi:TetR/AcrR family transcriptional regulator, regulator of cefoperazone and chloramphenicol sensitivity
MSESIVKRPYRSPLRQAQAKQTRQRILDAGLRLFAERGYPTTSVAQIAEAAGVSAETIYSSVGSKRGIIDALLAQIDAEGVIESARAAVAARGGTPRAVLEVYAETAGQFWAAHADLVEVLRKGVGDPEIGTAWFERESGRRGIFEAAVASWPPGTLRPGLDAEKAADIAWAVTGEETYGRLVERRGWWLDDYIAWVTSVLVRELLAEYGDVAGGDASVV